MLRDGGDKDEIFAATTGWPILSYRKVLVKARILPNSNRMAELSPLRSLPQALDKRALHFARVHLVQRLLS